MWADPDIYVFGFGKYKGKGYKEVPWNYLFWAHHCKPGFTLRPDELERVTLLNRKRVERKNYAIARRRGQL